MCHQSLKKKINKKKCHCLTNHTVPFELTACPCLHFETFHLLQASVTAGRSLSSLLEKRKWKPD